MSLTDANYILDTRGRRRKLRFLKGSGRIALLPARDQGAVGNLWDDPGYAAARELLDVTR